ncbi:XdhC family protein [Streptomyces capparidis]
MNDLWERLHRFWEAGAPCGLATVVSTFGSAPRHPGAVMLCAPDGTVAGSVSGGCVEGAVYDLAQQAMRDGDPVLERYAVSDDDAGAVGLTCGGTIEVFVERVDRRSFPELGALVHRARAGTAVALATVVESGGSVRAGAHLVCWADGAIGSTGDRALDGEAAAGARRLLGQGRSGTFRTESADAGSVGGPRVFVNCLAPPPRLLVYGASEFASALARQGALLGFRVTVCDGRPVFTTPARFPDADEVVVDWPHRHLAAEAAAGRVDGTTVVVSLTHDAKFEVPLLEAALRMDLAYVGALGSRRSAERRRASLLSAGVRRDRLARLSCPAGLDLGGASPAETALSILSEMLLLRHGGTGARLSGTTGAIHRESPAPVLSSSAAGPMGAE